MRDIPTHRLPTHFVAPRAGVPDAQALALDRRHRLERQQRAFRGPHPGTSAESAFAPEGFAINEAAGPGPA